jgi:hypothetical protein
MKTRGLLFLVPCLALVAGCPGTSPTDPAKKDVPTKDEGEIRKLFADFQAAVKERDGDQLWDLFADESQQDADRKAKTIKEDFAKADAEAKKAMAKKLDVPEADLGELTGKKYLKSQQFFGKYHEVPESSFQKAAITGDKATIHYKEEDGDAVKQPAVRENGKWKLVVEMPK